MRRFGRREGTVANPNPELLRQRLDALAGVDLRLPNYHEFSVLARGGSSVVFLARERRIDRPVAIKVLPPEKDLHAVKQFEREKEIAVSLGRHPYIVQVFDAGAASDGSPFLVMEYFERGSLADRLRAEGPLSVEETVSIIEKIGSALQAAHDAGILHRDVKPSNILFSEYGPSLSDFGISRSMSRGEWTQSLAHFTPWHSAPEILEGDNPSIASDVYSLASTMFTSLDGRPPFVVSGDDRSLAYQLRVLRDPLPTLLRRDLPSGLHDVLAKAMAKLPADRFDSVASFLAALRALPPLSRTDSGSAAHGNQQSSTGQSNQGMTDEVLGDDGTLAPVDVVFNAPPQQADRPATSAPVVDPGQAQSNHEDEREDEDDAMFRPPAQLTTKSISVHIVEETEQAPPLSFGAVEINQRPAERGYTLRTPQPVESASNTPVRSATPAPIRPGAPNNEQRNPAVRPAQVVERMSPAEEEATVLGQRRVTAPIQTVPNKRQIPLAWIALLVTALLGGLIIAFYPGKKTPKPITLPPTVTTVSESATGSSVPSNSSVSTPRVDPLPRVSASSPQQVTVTEKLEDSGEFSLAEIRWTDGTPPLVAAYVAASKQGGEPKAVRVEDAASRRAVIVGIDPKAAYCFWVVAFDTRVTPIVQYRSEQQCVRGGVPYNFN
jgi:serine/threonine protein kinase